MATMICVKCGLFMKIKKNGVPFEEGMPTGFIEIGGIEAVKWGPYKLWDSDLYKCQGCGVEILTGRGQTPIAEHYQPDYQAQRKRYPPLVVVNDCPGQYREEKPDSIVEHKANKIFQGTKE